ncbi:hypothetical protein LMG3431_02814 [Achromobacter pestifer]|uniref:Uncharacterized protein n=1 Tax=Achromobacter pestifer TaxID=1353889 RepID=A0A6S6Z244_9BURK|nr:hypothetical protein LMG3431_02814 [Achromobacter pestifer]
MSPVDPPSRWKAQVNIENINDMYFYLISQWYCANSSNSTRLCAGRQAYNALPQATPEAQAHWKL